MPVPSGWRRPGVITGIVIAAVLVFCCGLSGILGATGALDSPDTSDAGSSHSARPIPSGAVTSPTRAVTASPAATPTTRPARHSPHGTKATSALALLAALPVRPWASMAGYSRARFGPAWEDTDGNGCDTRNDILRRDLTHLTVRSDGCTVATGTLHDPYTGRTLNFHRGRGTSAAVQIDHLVALADAWRTGAQNLSTAQREHLANDPIELLAVDGPTNESKGDQDAASWLPPNVSFDCAYVADQITVKHTYRLWVTRTEHDAMVRVLAGCGGQTVPPTHRAPAPTTQPAQPQPPQPTQPPDNGGGAGPIVHPGSYCAPVGAMGVTDHGTPMRCSSKNGDRPRWRSAG